MITQKLNVFLLTSLFCSLFLVACNYRAFDLAEFPELKGGVLPGSSPREKITEQNFAFILETVIKTDCTNCHKPGGKAEDILFRSYQELMDAVTIDQDPLIIPGKPEESLFYTVMLPTARRMMPPKKSQLPPVSADRVEVVRKWILNGAQEK
jgi:hypothetical protein